MDSGAVLWKVLGTVLLIAMFTSCGAVDAELTDDIAQDVVEESAPIVLTAKVVDAPAAAPMLTGEYLVARDAHLAQMDGADTLPVCAHRADTATIARGGTQLVLQHAIDALDTLPLVQDGAALTVVAGGNEHAVSCGGHVTNGLVTLTCEISLRGVSEVCQVVMQRI